MANDVSAVIPEIWSAVLQDNLYKNLVSFGIANVQTRESLRYGDTINKQYFAALSATSYTPGTAITYMQELDYVTDQLVVNNYYVVATYVDDIEQLQANVDIQANILQDASYQLRDQIDVQVLSNTSAGTTAGHGQLVFGSTTNYHNGPLTATTANIVNVFANARRLLLEANCEDDGNWCAVLDPNTATKVVQRSSGLGFNFADAALRNGYIGEFMGFQIYVSNNVPSENGPSATRAVTSLSTETIRDLYFGRKGQIELLIQQTPKVELKDVANQIGKNILMWTVWGDTVYTRNKSRFLDVLCDATATTVGE